MSQPENGFTKAMRQTFTGGYWPLMPSPTFNEDIMRMVDEHHPDCVFMQIQTPGVISPSTARYIGILSTVFNFSGDIRLHLDDWYYETGKHLSCSLFTNMFDVRRMRERNVEADWMEIGFDPERYKTWDNPRRTTPSIVAHFNDYGVGYFPLSGYRLEILEALSKEFGKDFGVYGNVRGAKDNFNSDQVMESRNYCGAKIALNVSHFCVEKYSSDRLLRILGSGTFCLTHNFPAIEELYKPGEHLVTFDSINELIEKCHYYLTHDDERRRIAAAGQKHAMENYTFLHMAENIKKFYLKYKK